MIASSSLRGFSQDDSPSPRLICLPLWPKMQVKGGRVGWNRSVSRPGHVNDHDIVVRRRPQRTRIEEAIITIPTLMKPNVTTPSCQA